MSMRDQIQAIIDKINEALNELGEHIGLSHPIGNRAAAHLTSASDALSAHVAMKDEDERVANVGTEADHDAAASQSSPAPVPDKLDEELPGSDEDPPEGDEAS